jgi:hypothetical protein
MDDVQLTEWRQQCSIKQLTNRVNSEKRRYQKVICRLNYSINLWNNLKKEDFVQILEVFTVYAETIELNEQERTVLNKLKEVVE